MSENHAIRQLSENLRKVIRGKDNVVELIVVALCSNGHVLIEDVPGVGKTTLAKALALSLHGQFNRIQFTPDLLPTDISGGMIYSAKTGDFYFRPGPIFSNIVLADEINRASPRTQSALLEAMSERQVSIEGKRHVLADPFMVIATQNPVEYHGTYPLPEAQLDRFAMQLEMGYPREEEELQIILQQKTKHPIEELEAVATAEAIVEAQKAAREVAVEDSVLRYIALLVRATRDEARLKLGASPRASEILYRTTQALAFVRERDYVTPDDVKELAEPVLAHRVVLDTKARYAGTTKKELIREIVSTVRVPV